MNGHRNSITNSTECSASLEGLLRTNKKPSIIRERANRKQNRRKNRRNQTTLPDALPSPRRIQTRWTSTG